MKGRIETRGKCEHCQEKFVFFKEGREEGFRCPVCHLPSKRFRVNVRSFGGDYLTSTPAGDVLETYRQALKLWISINGAWEEAQKPGGKPFAIGEWVSSKVAQRKVEVLFSQYQASRKELVEVGDIVEGSYKKMCQRFRGFILPRFGERSINDFKVTSDEQAVRIFDELETWKIELLKSYSHNYTKRIFEDFRAFLNRYLRKLSPTFPKVKNIPQKEKQVLDTEREIKILSCVQECYRLPIEIMLTGESLRNGEVRGIKVHDVIPYHYINVEKTYARNQRKAGGRVKKRLPRHLWDKLLNHCQGKHPDDYVFTTPTGAPLYSTALYKAWKMGWKVANEKSIAETGKPIKYIDLRMSTRHSNVTDFINEEINAVYKKAGELLGDDPQTVKRAYYVDNDESKN